MRKLKIGLEVHLKLNTRFKLFSSAVSTDQDIENTKANYVDIGMPGTFPTVNIEAVKLAIKAAKILNCTVAEQLMFDRKHYYHPDLAIGYQITQHRLPIGKDGKYTIYIDDKDEKIVTIRDIHLEADAASIKKLDRKNIMDYNRAGAPLIEIVTDPCFETEGEIIMFLKLLKSDIVQNEISEANMHLGGFRVDVNISMTYTDGFVTPRLEIKNLGSFDDIVDAIKILREMEEPRSITTDYTVAYEDGRIKFVREKEKAEDYMYIPEQMLGISDIGFLRDAKITERSIDIYRFSRNILKFDIVNSILITCNPNIRKMYGRLSALKNSNLISNIIQTVLLVSKNIAIERFSLMRIYDFAYYLNSLLVEKKILKVNLNKVVQEYIQHCLKKNDDNFDYVIFIEQNDLIIKNDSSIDIDRTIDDFFVEEPEILTRMKNGEMKLINYMVGRIYKKNSSINIDSLKEKIVEKLGR